MYTTDKEEEWIVEKLTVDEQLDMQRRLQHQYRKIWTPMEPARGRDQLLWGIIEAGEAADIIKKAMVEVQRRLRREFPEAKLMIQVHDELDLSVPADQAQQVAAMLCEVMENVVSLRVPLSVDASWGDNWAQAH